MKTFFRLLAVVLLPAAAGAAQPRSVALVVQDGGLAQISETHDVEPPGSGGDGL